MTTEPTVFVLLTEDGDQGPDVTIYDTRAAAENAIRYLADCDWGNYETDWPAPPTELAACIKLLVQCGYRRVQVIRAELGAEPGESVLVDLDAAA